MLTIDGLMKAYVDAELTRDELFAHLVSILSPENIDAIMDRVQGEPELAGPLFKEWLDDVARGAQVFVEKRFVPVSRSALSAIEAWKSSPGGAASGERRAS